MGQPAYQRSYVSRHFFLDLDASGYEAPGYLRSIEGGKISADLVTHQVGGMPLRVKHLGIPTIEPFTVQVGLSMTKSFYSWVEKSWRGEVERRNGAVIICDHNFKPVHEQKFEEALITETTMPALDAAGREAAYMTVKFQAERSSHVIGPGGSPRALTPAKQKQWLPKYFRMSLNNEDVKRLYKIDSFTVKQNVKPVAVGSERVYQLEPTTLEYPNLVLTVALADADMFFAWHDDFVIKGNNSADKEKTGIISIYNPAFSKSLLDINLSGVGIAALSLEKSDATAEQPKKVRVELYVEEMSMTYNE